MWWVWRCFDPRIDFWPRASAVGLVYDDTLCLVDLMALEGFSADGGEDEARGKDVVRRIMQAQHLLKVVHELDERAMSALQRAVIPQSELHSEAPAFPSMAPVLDLAVVMAYMRRTYPSDDRCCKLNRLVYEFLRIELCNAEALGNFERRPMRQTQMHYLITLAWCPWMILRTLCSFGILEGEVQEPGHVSRLAVLLLVMRFGEPDQPPRWDPHMRKLSFVPRIAGNAVQNSTDRSAIKGEYGKNVWTDESDAGVEWRNSLPRPDRQLDPRQATQQSVPGLLLRDQADPLAKAAVEWLFDKESVVADLEAMYQAYGKAVRSAA